MKNHPVLFAAILVSLLLDAVVIVLVNLTIGPERLSSQLIRFAFQLFCVALIFSKWKRASIFMLSGFHIFSGLIHSERVGTIHLVFLIYHILLGLTIYFHTWIEGVVSNAGQNIESNEDSSNE